MILVFEKDYKAYIFSDTLLASFSEFGIIMKRREFYDISAVTTFTGSPSNRLFFPGGKRNVRVPICGQ
jgi:hypothetical protein